MNVDSIKQFSQIEEIITSGTKYDVILADPPWDFSNSSCKYRNGAKSNIKDYYRTMSFQALSQLPVSSIAADHSALLLWSTDAHLEWAMKLGVMWGFKFCTVQFVWSKKTSTGKQAQVLGPWGMKNCELCLLFTRGKAHSRLLRSRNTRQLVESPRGVHSAKPSEVATRIKSMFPTANCVELFARGLQPGWSVMGDQLT